jgi:hypothetical protein
MKKIYSTLLLLFTVFLFNSCSKDAFKSYEERIIGTWQLDDVNRVGIGGGDMDHLPFREGSFTFSDGGSLTYTDGAGQVYSGSWDIERIHSSDNMIRTLQLVVVNFATQELKSELFEEMYFTSTNKFKARITQGLHTYVFHFER